LILILSDINMPGMSGLELLPKAKAARPDVPIIMITAYGDPDTRRKALEGGAEALLTKPIDFVALRSEIDNRVTGAGAEVRYGLPAQPVDATQALNLSAGVSNCKVSRGRSLSWDEPLCSESIASDPARCGRKKAEDDGLPKARPIAFSDSPASSDPITPLSLTQ